MSGDMRWLEVRGRGFYAVKDVPRPLQATLGKRRLVKSLETRDVNVARARRHKALTEFERTIAEARRGSTRNPLLEEALSWRAALTAANDEGETAEHPWETKEETVNLLLVERAEAIEARQGTVAAQAFYGMATGTATPLLHHIDTFLAEGGSRGPVAPRTQRQYRSDLIAFAGWCEGTGLATVEAINKKVVGRYVGEAMVATGMDRKTANRKISAASAYWRWLQRRGHVEANPWTGQSLAKALRRDDQGNQKKRPFTAAEVRKLFAGDLSKDPELADAMLCGALTGARLEELFRLTVADCVDGQFNIRRSKSAAGIRRFPIHSGLVALIERRTADKDATAFLFHEAGPARDGRERSTAVSKRFGRYRQTVGVHEKGEGRRHSAVDFHSWRRWFVTEARNSGADTATVAAVVGHEVSGMTDGTYHGGVSEALKRACVEAVKLPD